MARKKIEREEVSRYTKEQFLQAKRYTHQKDIINVLLNDDEEYSFAEVDNIINEFLEREV
ncbi:hypothetical protein [Peptostreptococcus equinus]|uniref:Phage protein n=1 Tax=Peptostreptococcus equinus TaxID=3003601 RepID=A0ABY7JQN1_9FIRM|nr:hypothetical protein [Peptostreptococcus sp. CBA3647]WAW15454.1 hypothetical protein O0R46_03140 [Peptostreptococcus sp. CBA3647]